MEQMTSTCDMVGQYLQKNEEDKRITEDQAVKDQYWKILICYNDDDDDDDDDDDEEYTTAIIPDSPKTDSLIMVDKHLHTIPEMESDEFIKSSVENLDQNPNDIISIPPGNGNDHFNAESSLIESVLNRDNVISSPKIDFLLKEFAGELALIVPIPRGIMILKLSSIPTMIILRVMTILLEDIDYVDALPPDPELVGLEVVGNVVQEDGEIDTDILITIKDDILREKLLKVNLLIAKIEALKDNPTPSSDFVTKSPSTSSNFFLEETNTFDNSLPQFETFNFLDDHRKETSSGSTTTHADISLPEYDSFHLDSEPDSGDFTMDVVENIFDNPTREPRVHVPNVLPTHPTLHLDLDFTLSSESLGSDPVVSFSSETKNKIFDPEIFIEIQSKRFLSPNEFSISFIRDPLSPVFDTLLPFSSKNEDNVFNPGILASNEEKSPHLLSHWGFKAFQLISESPMMISGGDILILDVLIASDFEASRARGFVLRSLELQILSFIMGIQYPNLID
ncbi:hypothetical protein Tco_0750083 [Tanacetum coccineum]|uniref:Reverse transcriptase domain-containing protein n=1 Tax=Tanacetum coccineum TaxID=301880 RepID=A0ABQ4Z303_9ASTR